MKKKSLLLLLVISSTLSAGPDRGMGLDLTDDQKQQMAEVKERTETRKQAALKEIHAQAKAEMAEFLSPEQLAQVEDYMALRQEQVELRKEHQQLKRKMRRSKRL